MMPQLHFPESCPWRLLAGLHRELCSPEDYCPPAWQDKSVLYTCIYTIISKHKLSLQSLIQHFRMESQAFWQLDILVFKIPASLMPIFWMKTFYIEFLKTDDWIALFIAFVIQDSAGKMVLCIILSSHGSLSYQPVFCDSPKAPGDCIDMRFNCTLLPWWIWNDTWMLLLGICLLMTSRKSQPSWSRAWAWRLMICANSHLAHTSYRSQCCWISRNILMVIKTEQNKKLSLLINRSNQRNMLGTTSFSMVISLPMNHKKFPGRCSKNPTAASVHLIAPREKRHVL